MVKPLIIYHAGCMDGSGAALAAWLKCGDAAEYRAASYGDPAPADEEVRGRDVFVLDFSYSREEMERLHRANCDERVVFLTLDHHKTAAELVGDLPYVVVDQCKSGAVMAWEYFHCSGLADPPEDEGRVPDLLLYIQDRDLWRWQMPHSREVSAALAASGALEDFRALVPIYEEWAGAPGRCHTLVADGAAILRAESRMVERIAATAQVVMLDGDGEGECFLAAGSAILQSEVGNVLAVASRDDGRFSMGAVYYFDGPKGIWRVSLRSVGDFDVSAIAKRYGGGGHRNAAGFECRELPWRT